MADTKKKKSTKVIEIPVIPFDEQNTEDAAGKSTKINKKTGMAEGWKGGAPRKGDKKGEGWYGTGP